MHLRIVCFVGLLDCGYCLCDVFHVKYPWHIPYLVVCSMLRRLLLFLHALQGELKVYDSSTRININGDISERSIWNLNAYYNDPILLDEKYRMQLSNILNCGHHKMRM